MIYWDVLTFLRAGDQRRDDDRFNRHRAESVGGLPEVLAAGNARPRRRGDHPHECPNPTSVTPPESSPSNKAEGASP